MKIRKSLFRKSYKLIVILIFNFYTLFTKYPFSSKLLFYANLGGTFGFSVLLVLVIYAHFFQIKNTVNCKL